jgi:uncharacterized membrane protein YccC
MLSKLKGLLWPGLNNALFGLRLELEVLSALYLSFGLHLTNPRWSMLTTFVLMTPISGMVVAKGIARIFGTVAGASMGIILIATFAQDRILFIGALGTWLGVCVFFATLLRNFRSYAFLVAGFTAAIIVGDAYQMPESVFNVAVARSEEISLGIVVASVYSILAAPYAAFKAYRKSLRDVLQALGDYLDALTSGNIERAGQKLQPLLGQVLSLENMRGYARFDTPGRGKRDRLARRLHYRILNLLSAALTVQEHLRRRDSTDRERMAISTALGKLEPAARMLCEERPPKSKALTDAAAEGYQRIRRQVIEGEIAQRPLSEWLLLGRVLTIATRLRATLNLYDRLRTGRGLVIQRRTPVFSTPVAFGNARHNSARTFTAVAAVATFWFTTEWSSGSLALILTAALTLLLSQQPNPLKSGAPFMLGILIAIVVGFFYVFFVEPRLNAFATLALTLFPVFFVVGLAMANPPTAGAGRAFGVFFSVLLSPSNMTRPHAMSYLNSALAISTALAAVVLAFTLLWPAEPRGRIDRQLRGMFAELAQGFQGPRDRFQTRMYARLVSMLPLLDTLGAAKEATLAGALAAITIGIEGRSLDAALRRAGIDHQCRRGGQDFLRHLRALLGNYPADAGHLQRVVGQADRLRHGIARRAQRTETDEARRALVRAGVTVHVIGDALSSNTAFFTGTLEALPQDIKRAARAT